MDVYTPKSSRHHHTDGSYFGTGFPHMLFMVHPEYRPKRPANQFVPRCVTLALTWSLLLYSTKCVNMYALKCSIVLWLIKCYAFYSQVIWFQNSPNGLSASTSGCIKLQEPSQNRPLGVSIVSGLNCLLVETLDYIIINACTDYICDPFRLSICHHLL